MSSQTSGNRSASAFLFENSIFLILGALAALVWANADASWERNTYSHFVHFDLLQMFGESHETGQAANHHEATHAAAHGHDEHGDHAEVEAAHAGHHGLTIHFLINDILMALFFAIAAKEVWEAMLPGGALSDIKKAATPLIGTAGGVIGPALVYVAGAIAIGQLGELGNGWAIPCATDIAFSYLVAKLIFGSGHPAISFLLLLAIADDAVGLAILAVFYPSAETNFAWLLLTAAAVVIGLGMRRAKVSNFWWYLLIPGVLSWVSFYWAGIHAALGLVPIIPTLPHAKSDMGIFAENNQTDTLNAFEHWWKNPVELILGLFALVNAGVVLSAFGAGTWLVMAGLFIGKPLGIGLFTYFAMRMLRFELPGGMNMRHVIVLGCIASLGFTVALFVSTAAFPTPGPIQDSVKMGSLLSFLAPIAAFGSAMLLGVRPVVFGKPSQATSVGRESQPAS